MINKDEQYNTEGPGYLLIEQDSKFIYFFHPGGRAYVKINLKRTIRGIQLTLYEQNNIVEQVVLNMSVPIVIYLLRMMNGYFAD